MAAENGVITELVFIPSPGRGHIMAALEMAKLLLQRDERLSVTVLVIKPLPCTSSSTYTATAGGNQDDSSSRIRIMDLPEVDPLPIVARHPACFVNPLSEYIEAHEDHVRNAVIAILSRRSKKCRLAGFVIDMFCTSMIDVANEFKVPTYLFFTSNAAVLGLLFHFQGLRDDHKNDLKVVNYKSSDVSVMKVSIPTYESPVPVKLLPEDMFHEDDGPAFLNHAKRFRDTEGILINTLLELEPLAMKSLSHRDDQAIPQVYSVGPILHVSDDAKHNATQDSIIRWLDQQPSSSVVFLCFGSAGRFTKDQVIEIALALERCGHRFLWSLRKPPVGNTVNEPGEYEDFEQVLPQRFLERTSAGFGKVIGWAPQVAVLRHSAVGGFVSHCGWNSILESMWYGVPIAAWPLYGEQQMNAFWLVKHLKMAVEIKIDYRMGYDVIVSADEIDKSIKKLMDPHSDVRSNMEAMKVNCRMAVKEGGSSFDSIQDFMQSLIKHPTQI